VATHTKVWSQDIDKYIQAVGGREALSNIFALRCTIRVKYSQQKDYVSKQTITKDGLYKCETNELFGTRIVLYDGKKMVELAPTGHTYYPSNGEINEYVKRTFLLGEPWIALNADTITFIGEDVDSVHQYFVYKVKYLAFERTYFISKIDNLLYKVSMFNGKTVTYFSDYRQVGQLKIPFKREGFVDGESELSTFYLNIEFNPKLTQTYFRVD